MQDGLIERVSTVFPTLEKKKIKVRRRCGWGRGVVSFEKREGETVNCEVYTTNLFVSWRTGVKRGVRGHGETSRLGGGENK